MPERINEVVGGRLAMGALGVSNLRDGVTVGVRGEEELAAGGGGAERADEAVSISGMG